MNLIAKLLWRIRTIRVGCIKFVYQFDCVKKAVDDGLCLWEDFGL